MTDLLAATSAPTIGPEHRWASLRISAAARGAIRNALKTAPGWSEYRDQHACDLSGMSKGQLLYACERFDLDAEAIADRADRHASIETAQESQDSEEPPQQAVDEELRRTAEAARRLTAEIEARGFRTHDPEPAPAYNASNDTVHGHPAASLAQTDLAALALAQQLTALLQRPVTAPVDETAVRQIATEITAGIVGKAGEAICADYVRRIDESETRIAQKVHEITAELVRNLPVTRIEIAKPGEQAREVEGHKHPAFLTLARAAASRMGNGYAPNIWLAGPAGSGKTHAAHQLADALQRPFLHNGALSMAHELLGFIDAAGNYHRTAFRDAYENGGVYLFDEVDGSDNAALLALNAALANGHAQFPDGPIKRHPDCLIIATANTWGAGATAEYVGRAKIDAAFLSRFPVRIAWDYDAALEKALAGQFPAWAQRVQRAREKARAAGLKVLIDPRCTQAGAALLAAGFEPDEAASVTYLANLTPEQRRMIEG